MKEKFNKQYIGIILGLILPPLTTLIFYRARFWGQMTYFEFIQIMFGINSLGKLVSICVIPNLLMFLLALKIEYLWVVRGIIMATVVYAVTAGALALLNV